MLDLSAVDGLDENGTWIRGFEEDLGVLEGFGRCRGRSVMAGDDRCDSVSETALERTSIEVSGRGLTNVVCLSGSHNVVDVSVTLLPIW